MIKRLVRKIHDQSTILTNVCAHCYLIGEPLIMKAFIGISENLSVCA